MGVTDNTQLNVLLPGRLVRELKLDAVRLNVPLGTYSRLVFERFLGLPAAGRKAAFGPQHQRTVGRKLKAESRSRNSKTQKTQTLKTNRKQK